MLENRTWQAIEGTSSCRIYPVERKPDIKSSNSFLIRSADFLLVIDPGADSNQTTQILQAIDDALKNDPCPILILLTHCHHDHFKEMDALFRQDHLHPFLFVHEIGADILMRGDKDQTLSFLYKEPWTSRTADVRLFSAADREHSGEKQITLDHGNLSLPLKTDFFAVGNGKILCRQTIPLGDGDSIEMYPTPGHTPDSISLRVGSILFTGDLLFAANPGIAGAAGWNQEELIHSLHQVSWLLDNVPITICCLGHGSSLPASKAVKIIHQSSLHAEKLKNVAPLDSVRVQFLDEYARGLLEEASELFTVISGRLYSISYHLEKMAEIEEAQTIVTAVDIESIDQFLTEFNHFLASFNQKTGVKMETPMKALQVISKINRTFDDQRLDGLIDKSLLRRLRWLITDFLNVMQGVQDQQLLPALDLNPLLLNFMTRLKDTPFDQREIVDFVNNQDAFLKALIRRIAHHSVFKQTDFILEAEIGLLKVMIDNDRIEDLLTDLFERLAVAGASTIKVKTRQQDNEVYVSIQTEPVMIPERLEPRRIYFARRTLTAFGGEFHKETTTDGVVITLRLPISETWCPL
ncbi:MAG: MBL fold metallo-hydrolase [Candidatus Omnitrophota bacterium]|jgi:glyoxylase-like metal-dependent hydrolase (beta-lactamase superfamily II)|nr:MAG: MBL fold metallo-hydrolase [Candidatus Omnitrophota bacterium]